MSPYLFIFSISPFQCVSFFSFKIKIKTRKIITRSEEILDFFLLFFFPSFFVFILLVVLFFIFCVCVVVVVVVVYSICCDKPIIQWHHSNAVNVC